MGNASVTRPENPEPDVVLDGVNPGGDGEEDRGAVPAEDWGRGGGERRGEEGSVGWCRGGGRLLGGGGRSPGEQRGMRARRQPEILPLVPCAAHTQHERRTSLHLRPHGDPPGGVRRQERHPEHNRGVHGAFQELRGQHQARRAAADTEVGWADTERGSPQVGGFLLRGRRAPRCVAAPQDSRCGFEGGPGRA